MSRDAATGTWPATLHERRPWQTDPDQRSLTGARPSREDRLLSQITVEIPASIADAEVRLEPAVVAVCEAAAQQVATLETEGEHLAALGALLVRSEAVASSRIERVYADFDDLARASIGEHASDQARRTLAAARALAGLSAACDGGAPLTQAAILTAHRSLLADDPLEGNFAGHYRTQQNWIGGSDFTPRGAAHVPPPASRVRALMEDLVTFANRDDMSAVAQAAIVHAQFEAIHPFTDGNGRVGRALIGAVMRRRGLTRTVVVPVAAAMLADVDGYFDRLKDYREGSVDRLVSYVAESTIAAAEASRLSAQRFSAMTADWHSQVPGRRGSSARTLVDGLTGSPVIDIARAEQITGTSRPRTYAAIEALEDAGIVEEVTGGGRNRVWVASDVMSELAALEERIGVRSRPSHRWR